MKDHKVPVQSLIDHIKTAIDVDDWAKEMAEELLKEQEPKPVKVDTRKILDGETDDGPIYIMDTFYRCPSCGSVFSRTNKNYDIRYCEHCGQAVKWE